MKITHAEFIAEARQYPQLPEPCYCEIAFAGRSNVGKSSLINALVGRKKLVRTSNSPGCTRGIQIYRASSKEHTLDLIDFPGYGFAQRSKQERKIWEELVETYLEERVGLAGVVIVVDARRGVQEDDVELVEYLKMHNRRVVLVANKIDKFPLNQRKIWVQKNQKKFSVPTIGTSAKEALGLDLVWKQLNAFASFEPMEGA